MSTEVLTAVDTNISTVSSVTPYTLVTAGSSQMLVTIYRTTRRHSTEYIDLHFILYNEYLITQAQHHVIIIIMALQPFVGPWPLVQFLDPIHSR
jgi:hypothetical protein